MDCLQETVANLPPCSEEMEVRSSDLPTSDAAMDASCYAKTFYLPPDCSITLHICGICKAGRTSWSLFMMLLVYA